jgi:hypothetical protein
MQYCSAAKIHHSLFSMVSNFLTKTTKLSTDAAKQSTGDESAEPRRAEQSVRRRSSQAGFSSAMCRRGNRCCFAENEKGQAVPLVLSRFCFDRKTLCCNLTISTVSLSVSPTSSRTSVCALADPPTSSLLARRNPEARSAQRPAPQRPTQPTRKPERGAAAVRARYTPQYLHVARVRPRSSRALGGRALS